MSRTDASPLLAKVLTVSDGVAHGTRDDAGGRGVVDYLTGHGFDVIDHQVTEDGAGPVAERLRSMCAGFAGLVVTTGGTGFGPRDQTPEGTRAVVDREAPGVAEAMRLINPFGRLSRGVAGTCGTALICNAPGSPKGALEQLDAVVDMLPHALRLLASDPTEHGN